jgi:hypothetical protein
VKIVTIAFASAIALSAVAPVFAYESELENVASSMRPDEHQAAGMRPDEHQAAGMRPGEHQAAGIRADQHRPFDARAYAPLPAPVVAPYDFGIGSQS